MTWSAYEFMINPVTVPSRQLQAIEQVDAGSNQALGIISQAATGGMSILSAAACHGNPDMEMTRSKLLVANTHKQVHIQDMHDIHMHGQRHHHWHCR